MRRLHRQELPPYLYHGTSGWRSNCELAIQVTPRAASSSGCTFYYSDNAVYLTEGVRGAIAPQFISAVVILQSGEVITSPRAGTAPTGEAVAAGLRRAREARGGYMCAAFVALLCQWPLLTLVPYWCAQAGAETLVWCPQLSEQVRMPTLDSPRCTAVGDFPRGRVPRALRPTVGWPMDWPAGPLQFASVSTCTLPAAVPASTFCLCHFLPGHVVSKLDCVVPGGCSGVLLGQRPLWVPLALTCRTRRIPWILSCVVPR